MVIIADYPNNQKIYNNSYFSNLGDGAAQTVPRYLTGCGPNTDASGRPTDAITTSCVGREWHTEVGMLASSTGNATGIFDLAGGVWEYTHSVRSNVANDAPLLASSGLGAVSAWNFNRYSDVLYLNRDFLNCVNCPDWQPHQWGSFVGLTRYLGSATNETVGVHQGQTTAARGAWGGDFSLSPLPPSPWFVRGAHSGDAAGAGVFSFRWRTGGANAGLGWRPLLAGS